MKRTITESDFVNSFDQYNRGTNFSVKARKLLFQYLTEYEEDCGVEIELDPIAFCCDYTEYDSKQECIDSFKHLDAFEMCEEEFIRTIPGMGRPSDSYFFPSTRYHGYSYLISRSFSCTFPPGSVWYP